MNQEQIAALKAAAECVDGWGNCNEMWPASEEDGYITYAVGAVADGERYPVAEIDCAQYDSDAGADLADFYARANPAAILALLAERDALIARAEAAEKDANKWHDYVANRNKAHDRRFFASITIEGLTKYNELLCVRRVVDRAFCESSDGNEVLRAAEIAAAYFDAAMLDADAK